MNDLSLNKKIDDSIWVAKTLFSQGMVSGSTANLSFLHDGNIYISKTGGCFGLIKSDDFSKLDLNGSRLNDVAPSKEYPLHLSLYNKNADIGAIIHTHSFYSTIWSIVCSGEKVMPKYTPYLEMKLGKIGLVPYAMPGSKELFSLFDKNIDSNINGYLLKNHGPIVGDSDIMSAFYSLHELEESSKIAWNLKDLRIGEIK